MKNPRQEEICKKGESADQLLMEGKFREALKIYGEVGKEFETSKNVDSYLIAKLTIGVMRCHVKLGDFKTAYQVWNAGMEDSLYGIGIYALESAQTTVKDMICYDMLCAFLHTLGDTEPAEVAKAVNQYLSRVCEQALEDGDRGTMRLAISNWKQHLRDVYKASIPMEHAMPLIKFEKTLGETVKQQPIDFPPPTSWEKPRDFLEMSRFVDSKKITRPGKKSAS